MLPEVSAALAVLESALDNCRDSDQRKPEVIDAIKLLLLHAEERWPFVQFWRALGEPNAEGKWQEANASLNAIKLAVDAQPGRR